VNALQSNDDLDAIPVLPDDIPVTMPELPIRLTITNAQQFKAITEPVRSRILGIIQNQPATAKQIAGRLGASPGAIGHHLHVLEAAGLAKIVARRLVRGIVANYYTRTARIFTYDFPDEGTGSALGSLKIITRARDELAEATVSVGEDPNQFDAFLHIRVPPERARAYYDRLEALTEDLLHETPDPNGQVYGILVAMFKSPAYMQGSSTSTPPESSLADNGGEA